MPTATKLPRSAVRALLQFTLDLFDPLPADGPQAVAPHSASAPPPASPPRRSRVVRGESDGNLPHVGTAQFIHPQATREIQWDDVRIAYHFARGRRRTIGFRIGPHGLEVRAPRWTPLAEVDAALLEKSRWIVRKLQESQHREHSMDALRIRWEDGARFTLLGQTVQVRLAPDHPFASQGAHLDPAEPGATEQRLHVALPQSANEDQVRDAVQAWLMRFARSHFQQRLDFFAPRLGVQWTRLSLSNAHTRWGSAKADGSIRLNWRLVHFQPSIVDYVVVHELSHLRVMDHSPRFWDTVGSVVSDYKSLRRQLKEELIPRW